jgi:hypothetical protein
MDDSSTDPFDEYPTKGAHPPQQRSRPGAITRGLRVFSAALALAAFSLSLVIVTTDLIRCFHPKLVPWNLKSGFALLFIGISYLGLQLTLRRTRVQFILSVVVSIAFALWGAEQFLSNQALVSAIDDVVVLLFVLDLSIVIRGNLKH